MDEIVRNLFVGTIDDAGTPSALRTHDVDTVVSLTYETPADELSKDIEHVSVPMMDGPRNDADEFRRAVRTVYDRVREGECVLVHCSAGASRSVAVAAVVVSLVDSRDIDRAFQVVAESRAEADPHDALVRRAVSSWRELTD